MPRVDIEAFKIYKPTSADGSIDSLIDPIKSETNTFMANAGQIKNRLGVNSDARFHLLPGVEIQSKTIGVPGKTDARGKRAVVYQ